jgi:hypothetical protein
MLARLDGMVSQLDDSRHNSIWRADGRSSNTMRPKPHPTQNQAVGKLRDNTNEF